MKREIKDNFINLKRNLKRTLLLSICVIIFTSLSLFIFQLEYSVTKGYAMEVEFHENDILTKELGRNINYDTHELFKEEFGENSVIPKLKSSISVDNFPIKTIGTTTNLFDYGYYYNYELSYNFNEIEFTKGRGFNQGYEVVLDSVAYEILSKEEELKEIKIKGQVFNVVGVIESDLALKEEYDNCIDDICRGLVNPNMYISIANFNEFVNEELIELDNGYGIYVFDEFLFYNLDDNVEKNLDYVIEVLNYIDQDIVNIITKDKIIEDYLSTMYINDEFFLSIYIFGLFLSISNIAFIIQNNIKKRRKEYYIKMIYGATKLKLLKASLIDNIINFSIITVISIFLSMIVCKILLINVGISNFEIPIDKYLMISGINILVVIIINIFSVRKKINLKEH